MNQRWIKHRTMYRPANEVIATSEYEVAEITHDRDARSFLITHHYLGASYPAARFRYGLYRRGILSGVAVFSHPCNDAVLTNIFQCAPRMAVELGRFVLLDTVPGNGETYFLGRCFSRIRSEGLVGVVSFSDPLPRRSADGTLVFRGHCGTIYQAFNGVYLGRSTPRTLRLLPDGSVFNDRTIQKIRGQETGWRYGAELLYKFGAAEIADDPKLWLNQWLPKLTRAVRHPGNHKYCWALHKTIGKLIPRSLPYPKFDWLFSR